jgi:hypothetical protein
MRITGGRGVRVVQRGEIVTISADVQSTTTSVSAGDTRWIAFTIKAIDGDEFQVSENAVSIPNGTPIRWSETVTVEGSSATTSVYRYGAVVAGVNVPASSPAVGTSTYNYVGPEMPALGSSPATMTAWYDAYKLSTMVRAFVSGEYANATDSDIIWTLKSGRFKWLGAPSYLVQVQACQGTNATTTQPIVNVSIDDEDVTEDGVQMVGSVFEANAANDILTDGYGAVYGDIVKVAVTTAAVGATKAEDLTLEMLFVSE